MAERALLDRVRCVVATPHNSMGDTELSQKLVRDGVEDLRQALGDHGVELRVLPGLEVLLTPMTPALAKNGMVFPLNGSRYLLVELVSHSLPRYTEQVLYELQLQGYVPLLAHPERCKAFQEDIGILLRMVERGILTQVTAGSILGVFGRSAQNTAKVMLEHNLAHVIASDAHSASSRPPVLSEAVEYARRIVGEDLALAMVTSIPEALINDEVPDLPEPTVPRRKKSWILW